MLTSRMIEAFRAVILNGSMSEAATFLHISQPAVSRLIRDLETGIGFRLFDRRHGRIYPNDDALTFYEEVHRSYIGLNRISQAAEKIRKHETGSLRIACMPAIGLSIMPRIIADFRNLYPDVTISFKVVRSETAVQLVSSLDCDVGIVEASFSALSAEEGPIYRFDSVCVLPPDHRLAHKAVIEPKDLENEVFISLDPDSRTRFHIDLAFDTAGVKRMMQVETPMTNMACALVLEGCGVSIVDPMTAAIFARQGLVSRPFRPAATFSFRTLSSSRVSGNRLVEGFYDALARSVSKGAGLPPPARACRWPGYLMANSLAPSNKCALSRFM